MEAALQCSSNLNRNSCYLSAEQLGMRDSVAMIRIMISSLSILGSISIIVLAIGKKQLCTPKVQPIFVLSVADLLLAVLWMVGGVWWIRRGNHNGVWCFAISLPTIIVECVSVNLTLVYALMAYSGIKKKTFSNVLQAESEHPVWSKRATIAGYLTAWLLPVGLVMMQFSFVAGLSHMLQTADSCSCWCIPVFGNILPLAIPRDYPTAKYVYELDKLIGSYGVVLGTNYLIVFVLLVVIYYKLLQHIKRMRQHYEQIHDPFYHHGATEALIAKSQTKAKKRVFYFLTVFIINGLSNVILSYIFVVTEGIKIKRGPMIITDINFRVYPFILVIQSLTVPLQGFLNAIVYGWTRDDFLDVMAVDKSSSSRRAEMDSDYNAVQESFQSSSYYGRPTVQDDVPPLTDSQREQELIVHTINTDTVVSLITSDEEDRK